MKSQQLLAVDDNKQEEEEEEVKYDEPAAIKEAVSQMVDEVEKAKDEIVETGKQTQQKATNFWRSNKISILGAIIVFFVIIGTLFMIYIEGYDWASAFEWNFVTLSTVGYGDVTPATNGGKVFTIFYIIFGVSLVVYFGTGKLFVIYWICFGINLLLYFVFHI